MKLTVAARLDGRGACSLSMCYPDDEWTANLANTRHNVPVTCVLESESGEAVQRLEDRNGLLNSLIPPMSEQSFQCWRFIDEYGDTVFNRQQMPQFLTELAVIRDRTDNAALRRVLNDIEGVALRCRDEVHLYLKFYGD